ncbi:hypothetical protein [Caenispirillum bisanense]|uniref:hypothetical protein n=1 Tax=Caenispirillum bisanense TaxID=414052 RepID=UPI0031D02AF8
MASKDRADGHATGMAGEFFVMERLFRLGTLPALTVGNAKAVDILVRTKNGRNMAVSVKAVRGSAGKWVVGTDDFCDQFDLIFVFLLYKNFQDLDTNPRAWIVPAAEVEKIKRPHITVGNFAVYNSRDSLENLSQYENAWETYFR